MCMCVAETAPKKKKKSERYFEGAAAATEEAAPAAEKPKVCITACRHATHHRHCGCQLCARIVYIRMVSSCCLS